MRRKTRQILFLAAALSVVLCLNGCSSRVSETSHGVIVNLDGPSLGKVRLEVVNDDVIRVSAIPGKRFPDKESLMAAFAYPESKSWTVEENESGDVVLATSTLRAVVSSDGKVTFTDADGHILLSEADRLMEPFTDPQTDKKGVHKQSLSLRQLWRSGDDEAYYGLGQHQTDEFNYKDRDEQLFQYNTKVTVPFIVSTHGYGILWDNTSLSRWGDARDYAQLGNVFTLYDKEGKTGGLTGTYTSPKAPALTRVEPLIGYENEQANKRLMPPFPLDEAKVVFEGFLEAPETGIYRFLLYYAGYTRVFVNDEEVVAERWRTAWNPNSYKFTYPLQAGAKTHLRVEWQPDGGTSYCGLRVLTPRLAEEENTIAFWSEMGDMVDYYFVNGQSNADATQHSGTGETNANLTDMDRVIAGYRAVTGKAQVMPRWAMGFWQCRERYKTQDELVGTFAELRRRGVPVDVIVQDWFYWEEDKWGTHEFDSDRYPNPTEMVDDLHAMNGRFMLSVWPKFYASTEHFKEFDEKGWMYRQAIVDSIRDWVGPGYVGSFYDAYSAEARKLFWNQMNEHIYSKIPVDAWWMDASEPNVRDCQEFPYLKALCGPTDMGSSTEYLLAYGLMNADAIYNGQRSVNPNKRVFLLTRNGFAGLQRYSTAIWSGDIGTRWEDMKAQISAGINFCMAGIPFWGMDIGGFCTEKRYERGWNLFQQTGIENEDLKEWRELQTRWFQFGAFVPIFRVHGQFPGREIWNTSPEGHPAYESMLYYDKLRYRLMPYIYSLDGMVHFNDYTMMRGLPMDFAADAGTHNVGDQFMFGPALMACPVYTYGAREREVYFPRHKGGWYDFYSGRHVSDGGVRGLADAPYERMPLFVPAGAVIPMGPDMQWSGEKPLTQVELHIWEGQNGSFTLYEDEGTNYDYEHGQYCTTLMTYDDASGCVALAARDGFYAELVPEKDFHVILHRTDGTTATVDIHYDGEATSATF